MEIRPAQIDPTLLTQCAKPDLAGETNADVAIFIVEMDGVIDCANGKIAAIAETIDRQAGPK